MEANPLSVCRVAAGWLTAVLLLAAGSAGAGTWTGTLSDGSVLKVDPETRRATRLYGGGAAPLWDGTHRLEDGSVVIVRDGQAVPSESMIDAWRAEPGAEPTMRERYCEQLVRKVCGFDDECGQSQPCVLAHQLLRIERDEQRRVPLGSGPYPQTAGSGDCLEALGNPAFPACGTAPAARDASECRALVDRVCGKDGRCGSSPACDPARQLLELETEERLESADPSARTSMGAECERAMENAFFTPCE